MWKILDVCYCTLLHIHKPAAHLMKKYLNSVVEKFITKVPW